MLSNLNEGTGYPWPVHSIVRGNLTIRSSTVPLESVPKRGRELPTGSFLKICLTKKNLKKINVVETHTHRDIKKSCLDVVVDGGGWNVRLPCDGNRKTLSGAKEAQSGRIGVQQRSAGGRGGETRFDASARLCSSTIKISDGRTRKGKNSNLKIGTG